MKETQKNMTIDPIAVNLLFSTEWVMTVYVCNSIQIKKYSDIVVYKEHMTSSCVEEGLKEV